jgi:hypothetical protein
MGLLSRDEKLALSLSIVFLIVIIPVSFPNASSGTWRCTTQAWASGSPDETLNPQPIPPRKAASLHRMLEPSINGAQVTRESYDAVSISSRTGFRAWTNRWAWVLQLYLSFRPRF